MKHTPAPWRFNGNWLESATSQDMILTYTTDDDGLHGTDADKALIVAAPDLLEALEEAQRAMEEASVRNEAARVVSAAIHQARAAIAKARTP